MNYFNLLHKVKCNSNDNLYSCVTTIYSIYHFTNMIIACFVESTHHAFQDTFPTEEILLVQFELLDFTVSTMTT